MLGSKPEILLIEDDESLGYLLSQYLSLKNFNINWKKDGKAGLKCLEGQQFDLLILDVTLPDMSGFEVAEQVKEKYPAQPFIFLTSRSMKIDTLRGFSLGAIDYLKKPIDEEELVTRINVLLKLTTQQEISQPSQIQNIGEYRFTRATQHLQFKEKTYNLTERESDVLHYLVERQNNLADHREILLKLWGKNDYFNRKSLNVFISKLRKYLKHDPNIAIENVHNKGFILTIKK